MADESGNQLKAEEVSEKRRLWQLPKANMAAQVLVSLRLAALVATSIATGMMAMNKETKTITVAVVGTKPILQDFSANFHHTPAFVYFVIANGVASLYNTVVMLLRPRLKTKAHHTLVNLLDMVMFGMVATGAAAAASMAELGKNGNEHARWNPICDKFEAFCLRGGLALTASFVGVALIAIMNAITVIVLNKSATVNGSVVTPSS